MLGGSVSRLLRSSVFKRGSMACAALLYFSHTVAGSQNWRLIYPEAGSAAPGAAVLQVADFDRSDPAIAGLMFRCGRGAIETVVVLLEPLPPRSVGHIGLRAGSNAVAFETSTIPTGAGLLAPFDPSALMAGAWRDQRDLAIDVVVDGRSMKAVVDLAGLTPALANLDQTCGRQQGGPPADTR